MLPELISRGQLSCVGPRNLPSKFGHNQVNNSQDISDTEFEEVVVGGVRVRMVIFCPIQLILC